MNECTNAEYIQMIKINGKSRGSDRADQRIYAYDKQNHLKIKK